MRRQPSSEPPNVTHENLNFGPDKQFLQEQYWGPNINNEFDFELSMEITYSFVLLKLLNRKWNILGKNVFVPICRYYSCFSNYPLSGTLPLFNLFLQDESKYYETQKGLDALLYTLTKILHKWKCNKSVKFPKFSSL